MAAAIQCGAQVIVTDNLRDFPTVVADLIDMYEPIVYSCVQAMADNRKTPPATFDDILARLEASGLIESAAALRG